MHSAIQNARKEARVILDRYPEAIRKNYVDVEKIARLAGIRVVKEGFEDQRVSGFIQRKTLDGQPVIVINDSNTPERLRFTIAHELGHYFLHSSQSVHVDDVDTADLILYRNQESSQATHIQEIEANQFAAELLMPEQMITRDVQELRKGNTGMSEIVERLARQYRVSQTAMAIRMNKIA
jgi:Zn-dependent peptidase ImmA (M78 family)